MSVATYQPETRCCMSAYVERRLHIWLNRIHPRYNTVRLGNNTLQYDLFGLLGLLWFIPRIPGDIPRLAGGRIFHSNRMTGSLSVTFSYGCFVLCFHFSIYDTRLSKVIKNRHSREDTVVIFRSISDRLFHSEMRMN